MYICKYVYMHVCKYVYIIHIYITCLHKIKRNKNIFRQHIRITLMSNSTS
jgi:hypothetical protein